MVGEEGAMRKCLYHWNQKKQILVIYISNENVLFVAEELHFVLKMRFFVQNRQDSNYRTGLSGRFQNFLNCE